MGRLFKQSNDIVLARALANALSNLTKIALVASLLFYHVNETPRWPISTKPLVLINLKT